MRFARPRNPACRWLRRPATRLPGTSCLRRCRSTRPLGAGAVVVLGHAEYYPKFGFEPASRYGIGSEYDVPDDVFMLIELEPGCLDGVTGIAKYDQAFANAAEDTDENDSR